MKKKELIALSKALISVKDITGKKFGYFVARNINLINPEIEKAESDRQALLQSYGKKEDGKLVIENENVILEDQEGFNQEYEKLMEEEVEIKLFNISLKEVPELITAGQLSGIYLLINDTPE